MRRATRTSSYLALGSTELDADLIGRSNQLEYSGNDAIFAALRGRGCPIRAPKQLSCLGHRLDAPLRKQGSKLLTDAISSHTLPVDEEELRRPASTAAPIAPFGIAAKALSLVSSPKVAARSTTSPHLLLSYETNREGPPRW
jgi:hypothetical protein